MEKVEKLTADKYIFGVLRIVFGFIFLWAFLDKMFGLGFATTPEKSILAGGKATYGFLFYGDGPFSWLFQPMAGKFLTEFLFLAGLLGIGLALILGIGTRIAGYAGALLMILMWMASLPLDNNPIIDEHIIYAMLLIYIANIDAGRYLGLGSKWAKLNFVRRNPVLT